MVATKAVAHVADAAEQRERGNPEYAAAVELGGVRTFLAVPMLKEDDLIGSIILLPPRSPTLYRKADRAGKELRRASRHRHRERAVAQRTQAIA